MGYKDDNYSTKVCGHHPETCTCRDWDTKEERERGFTITNVDKEMVDIITKQGQELLPDFNITKNIFDFVNNLSDTKEEDNPFELPKVLPDDVFYESLEPKQETLEEGFDRIFDSIDYSEFDYTSFKLGAKWQQERMYSEEEVLELLLNRPGPYLSDEEIKKWFEQNKKK